MQTWRETFLQLSLGWLDIVGRHQKQLIPSLLVKDSWHAVEVTQQHNKPNPPALISKVLKISRQQLFTASENSAFSKVRSVSDPEPSVSRVVNFYFLFGFVQNTGRDRTKTVN